MGKINDLMKNINGISKISFRFENELGVLYETPSFKSNKDVFIDTIIINDIEYKITINKKDENALPLLKFYISKSIIEINDEKSLLIKNIITGEKINRDDLEEKYPWLLKRIGVLCIYVDTKTHEAFELIKEGYDQEEIITFSYDNKILVIGNLDDIYEHAVSISHTIESNISCKTIIYYSYITNYSELTSEIKKSNLKISVARKFNCEENILSDKDLMFEEIIDKIGDETKNDIVKQFKKGFKKVDEEMIKTIDVFFRSGLNLSEASKELFIHRNTLIYRLDKIQKYTKFDLRNFNEATIFKIIYTLWKEHEKNI
ncbi:MAG: PucR family transcriptional regulator [Clostridiales bacterium]|nr:PucR family transcriptional regulator [Clostridiales bacterium]